MDDFAVFRTALFFEVLFEVFGPVGIGLAGPTLAGFNYNAKDENSRSFVVSILDDDTTTGGWSVHDGISGVGTGARRGGLSLWSRVFSTSQLAHEGVSAEVVKIDTSNIGVIESTSTSSALLFAGASAVKVVVAASVGTTASGAREGRALELSGLVLAAKALQQTGGRFGGELVATKTNTDGTTSDFEAVHVGECCLRVSRINVPTGMVSKRKDMVVVIVTYCTNP